MVTLRSSAFQGTKLFYALEWKYFIANIESITENDLVILKKMPYRRASPCRRVPWSGVPLYLVPRDALK